jgi:uncharacterized repeat protein (TIGR01451 family)
MMYIIPTTIRRRRGLLALVTAGLALAMLVSAWLRFGVRVQAFTSCPFASSAVAACVSGHQTITQSAINQLSPSIQPSQTSAALIAGADLGVDRLETTVVFQPNAPFYELIPSLSYHHEHHFDRPLGENSQKAFNEGWAYLYGRRQAVISYLSNSRNVTDNSFSAALLELGKALHALQDAYSHSNYVDPGSFGLIGQAHSFADQVTFDDALQSDPASPLPPINLLNNLYNHVHLTLYNGATDPENPYGTCKATAPPAEAIGSADNYCHEIFSKDYPGKYLLDTSQLALLPADDAIYDSALTAATIATNRFIQGIASELPCQWQLVVTYGTTGAAPVSCPNTSSGTSGGGSTGGGTSGGGTTGGGTSSVPTNAIVFDAPDASGRSQIYIQALDATQSPVNGPVALTSGGGGQQQSQEPQWSLAASAGVNTLGRIAYQFGAPGVRGIHVVKADGTGDVQLTPLFNSVIAGGPQQGAAYPCQDARDPSWSPDGRYVAYACLVNSLTTSNYDIWIHVISKGTLNDPVDFDYPLLTLPSSLELRPSWSPDGTMIAFVTSAPGPVHTGTNSKIAVTQVRPTVTPIGPGGGAPFVQSASFSILTDDAFTDFSPTWSPDSQSIAYSTTRSGGHDIYRMSAKYGMGDPSTFFQLTTSPANDTNPAWSPDGRRIAFVSDRPSIDSTGNALSGVPQVWVMSATAGDADTFNLDLHQITADSANHNDPAWNPQTVGPQNSLVLVVPDVTVTSGIATPTGSGTVFVSDGLGNVVSGAVVTIIPPSTGTGTLGFGTSTSLTDGFGNLTFTVSEPTVQQSTADYPFAVAAFDPATGKTGTVQATIRVYGVGGVFPPQPPSPVIIVPPQVRLPVGQPVFRAQTKLSFIQKSQALTAQGLQDVAFEGFGFGALYGPIGGAAWDAFSIQGIALSYVGSAQYLILANDPPDPNFTAVAVPTFQPPLAIAGGGGPLSVNSLTLMNQSLNLKAMRNAYLQALTTSINRYTTALSAGDLASAALQRNAILAYEDTLEVLLQDTATVTQSLLLSVRGDGLPDLQLTASSIAALQNSIAANGFSSTMTQLLQQMGLAASDIQAIQASFVNTSAPSIAGSLFNAMQVDASTSQSASINFAQASPAVLPATPTISITGGTFPFDGSAHGATATATGLIGTPVSGSFTFTYTPGGSAAPVNVGTYSVTAQFTSSDLNYTDASNTGTITITPPPVQTPTTVVTGRMQFARVSHQATLLADGLVLVSGGQSGGTAIAQAELYDPATGTWFATGSNVIPRFDHTATLLLDGRVLVAAGVSSTSDCSSNVTGETYDPASGTWSLTGRLPSPVGTGHIAVLLLDGRVLVSGGGDRCGAVFNTAAIFDPSTSKWSATGNMTAPREFHSAALLSDGRVLVAGGATSSPFPVVASAEIYDPKTGVWSAVSSMGTARQTSCNGYTQPYLTSLSGGTILAAGGFSGPNCSSITPHRTVSSLTVSPSPALLSNVGQTQPLTVTAQMSDGSTQLFTGPLQFSSADTTVATVDSNGLISSVATGTTTITATATGIAPVSVTTTVASRALTSIVASPASITMIGAGQTQSLSINGQYSDGSQQALTSGVTFVSSNTSVASVDATGLITSVANGTATITATAQGAPAVQVSITVKSLVSISVSPTTLTLTTLGQVQPLTVTGQFSDGSQQILIGTASFISSNPSVARVDLSGNVTALANGTATITVSLPNVTAVPVQVTVALVTPPVLSVTKSHAGSFAQGQQGATYTVTVSNAAGVGPTTGIVTVTDTLPAGLTLVSTAGTGWLCGTGTSCMRSDALAGGASYPPITVTVNVAAAATSPLVNAVTVSGGGSATANATDSTTITPITSALSITKSHAGVFLQGQQGAIYTILISNAANTAPTNGTVTITDTVPTGLTLVSMNGTGWQCVSASCTRTDALAPGASYPPITVTVNVVASATSPQLNVASVTGGGSASANTSDLTTIALAPSSGEADAVPFSALNLAGVTGGIPLQLESDALPVSVLNVGGAAPGQPVSLEADGVPFSVLNTAGSTSGGNQPIPEEVDAWLFSVLNLAGVSGSQPMSMEADGVPFSVLNTAGSTSGSSQPTPFEVDGWPFSILNLAGVSGNQPVPMEADGIPFSVNETNTGAPPGAH